MSRSLVTGSTGMLGRILVERLLAAGVQVRLFLRPASQPGELSALPVEIVRGETGDLALLRGCVEGCQWVYHLAAYLHVGSTFGSGGEGFEKYKSANVDFTQALLAASLEAGVGRFVFASSASVYDPFATSPISEDARLAPAVDYGRSKLMAEDHVRDFQLRGLNTTIVRPCLVYGRGDRHFLPAASGLARLPILPLVDGGRHLLDVVYAGDVAELMWMASQASVAINKVYNAASGSPQSLRSMIKEYGHCYGHVPAIWPVSLSTFRRFGWLFRVFLRRWAPDVEALLDPLGIAYMSRDIFYDMSAAKRDLGYTPQVKFKRGLELSKPL